MFSNAKIFSYTMQVVTTIKKDMGLWLFEWPKLLLIQLWSKKSILQNMTDFTLVP